jgi:hypothetical protein
VARPRTNKVRLVREKLLARLGDGLHRPGDRFLSARAVSTQFGVSYQTADRLLAALVEDGRLVRRAGSGTYVPGELAQRLAGVQLVFDRRARRAGSFGARLRDELLRALRSAGVVDVRTTYVGGTSPASVARDRYPILWESPRTAAVLAASRRAGLIVNDRPPAGLGALVLDSIAVDDELGGAIAAEMMSQRIPHDGVVGVLAGPRGDARGERRVAGFKSILERAVIMHAPTWFRDDALPRAKQLLGKSPAGVFACSDRLAQSVLDAAVLLGSPAPVLFGFDDAPIAEERHLSTIAIPWHALASAATEVALRRLAGEAVTASHLILAPRPVVRLT